MDTLTSGKKNTDIHTHYVQQSLNTFAAAIDSFQTAICLIDDDLRKSKEAATFHIEEARGYHQVNVKLLQDRDQLAATVEGLRRANTSLHADLQRSMEVNDMLQRKLFELESDHDAKIAFLEAEKLEMSWVRPSQVSPGDIYPRMSTLESMVHSEDKYSGSENVSIGSCKDNDDLFSDSEK